MELNTTHGHHYFLPLIQLGFRDLSKSGNSGKMREEEIILLSSLSQEASIVEGSAILG
jgi:hypothetical protein